MSRVYFTDTNSNLNEAEAKDLGLVLIKMPYVFEGKLYYDGDGVSVDETKISTAALNPSEYQQIFEPYLGKELVYISFSHKQSSTFEHLASANIPNLKVIDSKFIGMAQVEVCKRIMKNLHYDGIRLFFITDNKLANARVKTNCGWGLFEMQDGAIVLLDKFFSRGKALQELKARINSPLFYGESLNNTLRHHLGKNFIGGIYVNN